MHFRKILYDIVEVGKENNKLSRIYDFSMMITIVISMFPLMFKNENRVFYIIDKFTVAIFIMDYILRLATADYKIKKGYKSFFVYPFTFMAIIDLISIMPSITIFNSALKLLKTFRLIKTLRVFRVFKSIRYSQNINIIINVFKKQKDSLIVVCCLAVGYILISAIVIFNIEPNTFDNFFEAIYWATISLTTVGYGDIYATSTVGKFITMVSAVLGIAIVALPAGIITAGYMSEIKKSNEKDE